MTYDSTSEDEERCKSIKSQHDDALEGFYKASDDSDRCEENAGATTESTVIDQRGSMTWAISVNEDSRQSHDNSAEEELKSHQVSDHSDGLSKNRLTWRTRTPSVTIILTGNAYV